MRKGRIIAVLALFAGAGLLFSQSRYNAGDEAAPALESALRAQNRQVARSVALRFTQLKQSADEILRDLRWKEPQALQNTLNSAPPGSPRWVSYEGKTYSAASVNTFSSGLLEAAAAPGEAWYVALIVQRYFLLWRGEWRGKRFAVAFDLEEVGAPLPLAGAFHSWIVTRSGRVLLHSQRRFWGVNAANLRIVALAGAALVQKRSQEIFETYSGLESERTAGVWSSVPEHAIAVVSEWPASSRPLRDLRVWGEWLAWAMVLAALFLWRGIAGFSAGSRAQSPAVMPLPAREAVPAAYQLFERFLRRAWQLPTGKQVWQLATEALSELYGRSAVVYFRYSATSCCLVPEYAAGLEAMDRPAQDFLLDGRIYLGDFALADTLLETTAFARWEETRARMLPLSQAEMLPFLSVQTTHKSVLLLLVEPEVKSSLDPVLTARMARLILDAAANLYEAKRHLLQSKDVKSASRKDLAGPANQLRG